MENFQVGISFVPENRELLAFLKELEKSLGAIQFDGSKVKVADLEKRLSEVSDKASDLLPVFRLLGQEIEGVDGEKFLDFSDAIGDAKKQVANLVSEIEGTEIALPEIDVPKIEIPEIEIPKISLEDVDVPDIDFDADELSDALRDVTSESEAFRVAQEKAGKVAGSVSEESADGYSDLQLQIRQAQEEIEKLKQQLEDIGNNDNNPLENFFKFEAIQQAGEALSSFAEKGQETAAALAKVQTSAQATGVSIESLKGAAAELFASKGAESYADALEKIAVANRFLGDTFQGEELAKFTTGLSAVASATGADLEDTIKKSSTFVKGFGVDGKQAYDLLALGSQKAITSGDDFVDVIGEYSPLMKEAGFSAEEFVGTLVKVGKDGTFNLDKVGDAIKETQIRLNAGDIGNAFKDLGDIPPDLGDKLNAALEKATKGQISVKDFLVEATAATNEANLSDAMKTKIQTAISGTPAEEIGHELYGKLFGQKVPVDQIREDAILAGEQVRQSLGDTNIFSDLSAGATVAFENIAASIAPIAAPLGGILTGVSSIAPAVTLLDGKFGLLTKFGGVFKDIGVKILSLIPALGAQTVATGAATTATTGLNATMLANPAFLLVAGIAALVGAFILFSDSAKDVETAVSDANAALDDFEQKTQLEKATVAQSKSLRDLAAEYDSLKEKSDPESQKRFAEVSAELASRVPSSVNAITELGTSSEASAKQIAIATDEVRSFADENERLAKEAKAESLENLADQAAALTESYKAAKEEQAELREERDELLAQEKAFGKDTKSINDTGNPFSFDTIGDDLKDVRSELGGISGEVDKAEQGLRDMVKRLSDGGKSTEEIAELTGLTVEEIKKFSNESAKSKGAVDGTKGAVKKVATETEKATKKAKELSDQFSAAQKEASDFSAASIGALAQSLLNLQAARQKGDKAAIAAAEAQVKADQKVAQEAVKSRNGIGKIYEQARKLAGDIAPQAAQAVSKEVINAAEEVKAILDKLNNELAIQAKSDLDAELEKLRQAEEAELASIKARAEELRKAQKEKGKIVKGAEAIKELEAGGKAELAVTAKYQKERLDAQNNYYAKLIAQESQLVQGVVAQEIAELQFAEEQISGDSEEALKQRLEARLKILSLQQATETRAIVDADAGYIAAYSELQRAIAELDALTLSDATRAERDAAQARVQANRERLAQTESDILKGNRKIALIDRRFEQQTKDAIEDIRAEAYAKKQRELDEDIATSLRKREKELELTAKLIERAISAQEAISGAGIDEDSDEEIKAVERDKELRIITAQEAEERIAEIKKRAERKRLAAQKQAEGARLESERQANLARLEEEKAALEKRLRLAEASGDKRGAEEIRRKLGEVGKEIDEQGSILVAASSEIQDAVTGIFSSLFNDDPEKAKESFRSLFQVLAGGLQRIASAKVTQILFDSILPGLGFSDALLKTVGLKPLIEGLMNALLAPVLQGLLSFPTGGAVSFDKPTLVQVGDGARLGGINREYIFRDDQLRQVIRESSVNSGSQRSERILSRIQVAVESIPDKMVVTEEALWGAIQRQAIIRRGKAI